MAEPTDVALIASLGEEALALLAKRLQPHWCEPATAADDGMLTVAAAAHLTKLHEKTVRRAIERGDLAGTKVNGRIRIPRTDFNAWITSGRRAPATVRVQHRDRGGGDGRGGGLRGLLAAGEQQRYAADTSKKRPRTAGTAGA